MLIIQIQGYVLGILTLTFVIINEFVKIIDEPIGIVIIVLFVSTLLSIIITIITGIISKKR